MVSLHGILWFVYFARACNEVERSRPSGLLNLAIFALEGYIWRSILASFAHHPFKSYYLARNMTVSTILWLLLSNLLVTPALFLVKLVIVIAKDWQWIRKLAELGALQVLLRFCGVCFGLWRYSNMAMEDTGLFVKDIVAYGLASGIGVRVAASFSNMKSSRDFLQPPYLPIKLVLRFVHAVLRHAFDLLQHVFLALFFAERDVLRRSTWLVSGLSKLLLTCFLYQAVLILLHLAADWAYDVLQLDDSLLEELLEASGLGLFVAGFAFICRKRYRRLVGLEDRVENGRER